MTAPLTVEAANHSTSAFAGAGKLTGLAIVALLPAFFWTAILAFVAHMFGAELSASTIAGTAMAIMLFLTTIFAALATGSEKS